MGHVKTIKIFKIHKIQRLQWNVFFKATTEKWLSFEKKLWPILSSSFG